MRARSRLNSIGERDNIVVSPTGIDIWHGPTSVVPVPPAAGEQMELISTSGQDSATGTGVREVLIHYLDGSGNQQITTVTMTGLTPVLLPVEANDVKFVQDIHAVSVGTNGVAEGDIHIRSTATPANVYDLIKVGGNMSLTANKMVPANKTLYITHWHASATGSKRITLRLRSTDHHGILYNSTNPVYIFKDTVNLENSAFDRRWTTEELFAIPPLSIVKFSAWASGVGSYVSVGWDGILIDTQ